MEGEAAMKLCDCKCHAAGAKCDKCSATWAHECNQTNDFSVDTRTVEVKTDVRPLPGKSEKDMVLDLRNQAKSPSFTEVAFRRPTPEDYGVSSELLKSKPRFV